LTTQGNAAWTYGRFEMRALLPQRQGVWPAFWMLPEGSEYEKWTASGEIDILEAVNLGVECDECEEGGENTLLGTLPHIWRNLGARPLYLDFRWRAFCHRTGWRLVHHGDQRSARPVRSAISSDRQSRDWGPLARRARPRRRFVGEFSQADGNRLGSRLAMRSGGG